MIATAATAKFSVAYLPAATPPATNASNHPGNFFDWTTLSMTTLMCQGWRTSAKVSPTTASSASVSAFQCGRRSVWMRISVNGVDGDNRVHKRRNGGNGETNGADGAFEPENQPLAAASDAVRRRRAATHADESDRKTRTLESCSVRVFRSDPSASAGLLRRQAVEPFFSVRAPFTPLLRL